MTAGRAAGLVTILVDRPTRRRGNVYLRSLRRQVSRLRDRRRLLAILLLALAGGIGLAGMMARGELGGADARAYWAAVRIWLNGGDPYHPASPFMPYVYAPWLLPVFTPWALLPWDVAWFVWRGGTILLLLWSVAWAYRLHPLGTAVVALLLAFPTFANLDTGNIDLVLVLLLWGARFVGPRTAGLLWVIATAMKWVPIAFIGILAPRARLNGVIFLAIAGLLTLATLPLTIVQFSVLFAFPRPVRLDYLVFLWALVPSLWLRPDPTWFLRPATWRAWARDWQAAIREPDILVARARGAFGLVPAPPPRATTAVATRP
jgi:hypothetical protein